MVSDHFLERNCSRNLWKLSLWWSFRLQQLKS